MPFKNTKSYKKRFWNLTASWRALEKPIRGTVGNVERYSSACLPLHNYMCLTYNAHYSPAGFIYSKDKDENICPGEWRLVRSNQSRNLKKLQPVRGSRIRQDVLQITNNLENYLNSKGGSVP